MQIFARIFLILTCHIIFCIPTAWAEHPSNPIDDDSLVSLSNYRMGSGDLIKIQVFGEPDLSMETRLSDAGTVSYPFFGELMLKGLSTGELETMLTQKLSNGYLMDPKVSVTVLEYRKFYVDGEVNKPGAYPFVPGLNVQKAVSLAGGMTDYASKKAMQIIRDVAGKQQTIDKVDMETPMYPGDILDIGESFF